MSSVLRFFIQAGNDVITTKSYSVAVFTILFYDHFLTLGDEIKYVWSGPKSWTFWLFIVNRYLPVTYQIWFLATSFGPYSATRLCEKTAWYPLFMFSVCTVLAQAVLTLRIYAVTMKNVPTTLVFAVITASQFALGAWMTVLAVIKGAEMIPPIHLDAYHICIFVRHRTLEIAFTSISLLFDNLAFSLIIFLAARSSREMAGLRLKFPSILETIAQDATRYFVVIFTSHFVLMMTLVLARETIQFLPAPGNVVYLPVMISRLMISLKKAADPQRVEVSHAEQPANSTNLPTIQFVRPRGGATETGGEIPLDTTQPEIQTVPRGE